MCSSFTTRLWIYLSFILFFWIVLSSRPWNARQIKSTFSSTFLHNSVLILLLVRLTNWQSIVKLLLSINPADSYAAVVIAPAALSDILNLSATSATEEKLGFSFKTANTFFCGWYAVTVSILSSDPSDSLESLSLFSIVVPLSLSLINVAFL